MRNPRWPLLGLVSFLVLGITGAGARATLVIFKDGFLLYGGIKQPGSIYADPNSGQNVWMPKGFFVLDDGARRVFFSHSQVQEVLDRDLAKETDFIKLEQRVSRANALPMQPILEVVSPLSPWNAKWERLFKFDSLNGRVHIQQRLAYLSPQFARADALKYNWSAFYQTRELGAEELRRLLYNYKDLKKKDAGARFRVYRFLAQVGWYDEAEAELKDLLKTFPDEQSKVEEARAGLAKLQALERYEQIEVADAAGRRAWVRQQLEQFPRQGIDDKLLSNVRTRQAGYEVTNANLETARRLLKTLPLLTDSRERAFFLETAAVIGQELIPENVGRLEAFLSLAQQAERDQKLKKKPARNPAELLSLAVTGWLQGKDSAEAKPEAARRLWAARQLVLEFLRADDASERERMVRKYVANKSDAVAIDEMTQLIGFLPPPQAEKSPSAEPMELQTESTDSRAKGIRYVVQLPPEYHPSRPYPVLFALHFGRDKPEAMIERVRKLAMEHGYIVVAPSWTLPLEDIYHFSAAEHAAVVDVLRDVRRRFGVDSDRVFIFGGGQGGNMAYDVGLAHPDLFAGVLVMEGQPQKFAGRYWHNAQLLPMYIVDGDHGFDTAKKNRAMMEKWVPHGYPAIYVEYKGRGSEWFDNELPYMFDWMDHKRDLRRRATAVPELGKHGNGGPFGEEFQTMRAVDNHFYWLSTDAIAERNLNDPENWSNQTLEATLQAKILEGNQINVNVRGLKHLTVWLGRDMIDFTKPVSVRLNSGRTSYQNRMVAKSMYTMLEDLYQRGDRQRLFWARLDFDRF